MKTLLTCFAVLAFNFGYAQTSSWAPVGAVWRYDFHYWGAISYVVVQTAARDTVINDKYAMQMLHEYYDNTIQPIGSPDTFYIGIDSSGLYLLRNGVFHKFYDTEWMPGDTIPVPGVDYDCTDTFGIQTIADTGQHYAIGRSFPYKEFSYDGTQPWQLSSPYYYFALGGRYGILPDDPYCSIDQGGIVLVCYKDSSTPGLFLHPFQESIFDTNGICDPYAVPVGIGILPQVKTGAQQLNLFPNPATSTFRVEAPGNANSLLTLYTLTGQKVKEVLLTGKTTDVDVSGLPNGMYLVMMQDHGTGGLRVGKLVVQR